MTKELEEIRDKFAYSLRSKKCDVNLVKLGFNACHKELEPKIEKLEAELSKYTVYGTDFCYECDFQSKTLYSYGKSACWKCCEKIGVR